MNPILKGVMFTIGYIFIMGGFTVLIIKRANWERESFTYYFGFIFALYCILLYFTTFYKQEGFGNSKKVILFHMKGCGHCEDLMPTWDKLSGEYGHLSKIDADNSYMIEKYNITGFPTILSIEGGKTTKYGGDRTYEDLKSFVQ